MTKIRARDLAERTAWTGIAAGTVALAGAVPAAAFLDVDAWRAAVALSAAAASTAVLNAVTVIARYRLSVLPDPGAGLPGLPTEEG